MTQNDYDNLVRINKLCKDISLFIRHQTVDEFTQNKLTICAVSFCIIHIGESAKMLSQEIKLTQYEIKWDELVGMRNRLSHNIDDIDFRTVWFAASIDCTNLEQKINKLIS